MCVSCRAPTFEVWTTLPKWAAQVLKHLAPEISYRSLVALAITWVNGTPVSSFDRQDADQLIFFCSNQCGDQAIQNVWYAHVSVGGDNKMSPSLKPRLKPAIMRPLPHSRKQQMHPFMGFPRSFIHDASQVKPSLPAPPVKDNAENHHPGHHRLGHVSSHQSH